MDDILNKITLDVISSLFLITFCIAGLYFTVTALKSKASKPFFLKIIITYMTITVLQLVVASIGYYFGKFSLTNLSAFIYIICEYILLVVLLRNFIQSRLIKNILTYSIYIFIPLAIIVWSLLGKWSSIFAVVTTIEGIIIISGCLYYFFEILKFPKYLSLEKEPSFWVTTGILFLFVCITPYYLSFEFLAKKNSTPLIDYLGYIIIITLFSKAAICYKNYSI